MKNNTRVFLIMILFLSITLLLQPQNGMADEIMSPKKQMSLGTEPNDVVCKEGLVLMIRSSNGAAACVTSSTSVKLSSSGWGQISESQQNGSEIKVNIEDELGLSTETPMDEDTSDKEIELEEELSMNTEDDKSEVEPFSIGGIDLSMASPVEGSEDATFTIIEFGDYQCPNCKNWFQNEKPTISSSYLESGQAKLYFVDFTFIGDDSVAAAQAAFCAGDQDKYSEYHSILYNNQGGVNTGWANHDALKLFAQELELDTEMFNECLESGKFFDRVSYNTNIGLQNGVTGTPHFFIVNQNGDVKEIKGPQPAMIFEATINSLS